MFRGSRRTTLPSILTLLVSFAASSVIAAAQSSPAAPPEGDKAPLHQPTSAHVLEIKAFEQYIAYWTAEPGWRTELQLRNNRVAADLTVTPALRSAGGDETALPPVTIRPGEVVSIDLSKVVVQNARRSPAAMALWYFATARRRNAFSTRRR